MKKIRIFLLVICIGFYSLLISCDGTEYIIQLENKTGSEIKILSFLKYGRNTQDSVFLLKPNMQKEVCFDSMTSGTTIIFIYKGKYYSINTGYADDYWRYTIQFLESNASLIEIECLFIARGGFSGDKIYLLEVTQMDYLMFDLESFERERTNLESNGIVSYTFDMYGYQAGISIMVDIRITVIDRKIMKVETLEGRLLSDDIEFLPCFLENWGTFDKIYYSIYSTYENTKKSVEKLKQEEEYVNIVVQYDSQYYYPEIISVNNGSFFGEIQTDGSTYIQIGNFQPISYY